MPELRLDSYEVDESNKFAVALCKALVNLEKGYSPLLIHGERGSGKTHLLTAVTTELALAHPEISLLFISEDTSIESVFGKSDGSNGESTEAMLREYSRKDFLIVDDLERLAGNPATQEKFSALFSTFVDSGKQILVASGVPIKDLRGFDKRFISRLHGGVDAHLSSPRPETRLRILKQECARIGLELDAAIMQMLMREAGKDALYLKRLPGHLKTFATLNHQSLTKERVEEFLSIIREQMGEEKHSATTEEIVSSWVQTQAKKREDDLQATLREHEQELQSYKEKNERLQREVEQIKSHQSGPAPEAAGLPTKLKTLQAELDEKERRLKSQGKVISSEIGALTKEIKERERVIEHLKKDYETDLGEKKAEISGLEAGIETLKKETEDQLLALKIQLEDREQKLVLLREERERRASQQQKEKSDLNEAKEESFLLKQALNELNGRLKELEKQLAQAKKEAAQTGQSQRFSSDEKQKLLQELQELRDRQEEEAARQSAALEKAKKQLQHLDSEQAELKQAVQQKNERLNELNDLQKKLTEEADAVTQALKAERSRAGSLEQALLGSESRADSAESNTAVTEQKLKEVSHNHQRSREETERIRSDRDRLKQDISNLTLEFESVKAKVDQQEQTLAQKTSEAETLTAANQGLREQLSKIEQVLLQKEREDTERIRKFHVDMEGREEQLQAAESELSAQQAALKDARAQNEDLTKHLDRLAEDLAATRKDKESLEQTLSGSLQKAQVELEDKKKKLAELRLEVEQSDARADELAKRLDEVQVHWQERLQQNEKQQAEQEKALGNKNAALQRELQESAGIIKRLKSHVGELEERVRQRDQLLEAKEKGEAEHVQKLKDELKRRDEDLQAALSAHSATSEKGEALAQKVDELSLELAAVKEEKEKASAAAAAAAESLEEQLRSAKEQSAALASQLAENNTSLGDLQKNLEEREREVLGRTGELSALQEKLGNIENEKASLEAKKQALEQKLAQAVQEHQDALQEGREKLQESRERLREAVAREEESLGRMESERVSSAQRIERQRKEAAAREKALVDSKASLDAEFKALADQLQMSRLKLEEAQHDLERQAELKELAEQDALRLNKAGEEKDLRIRELQQAVESLRQDFSKKMTDGAEAKDRFVSLEKELTARERALAAVRQDYSDLQVDYDRLKNEVAKSEKEWNRLQSEKKKQEQDKKTRDEQVKALQDELRKLRARAEQNEEEVYSRVQELERVVAEKETLLQTAESRAQRAVEEVTARMDDEREHLTATHEKEADSLRSGVKASANEMAKIHEDYEKRLLQQREENDVLRARLAQLERVEQAPPAGIPEAKEAPPPAAVSTQPAEPEQPAVVRPADEAPPPVEPPPAQVAKPAAPIRPVDWLYSFADFRSTDVNNFTKGMAEKIARNPAKLYNPLFLYGPANSGKTHLLHALGKLCATQFPHIQAELTRLEELIRNLEDQPEALKEWAETVRLLIIDDFDISSVPSEKQARLHGALSGFLKSGTQIVLASEAPPVKMENLEEGMLNFIEGGLLAKLEMDPQIREMEKEAVEAIASAGRALFESAEAQKQPAAQLRAEAQAQAAPAPAAEEKKDFLMEFLKPDSSLTIATFNGKEVIEEFEDIFKSPNKRWRNKFPLLVMEDDRQRRCHFLNALAHRLQGVFTGPVSYFSIERLCLALSRKQAMDWNGLLNRLIKSHVILIDDCDSVSKLPPSTAGYLRAIIEEVLGRDMLLMIGMSKKYKKEPIFGPAVKKASKKKI